MTTNPLELIPATARGIVIVTATVIGVAIPFIIPDLPTVGQHILQGLCAVAAIFSGGQSLSNLTPDSMNHAIQTRRTTTPPGGDTTDTN